MKINFTHAFKQGNGLDRKYTLSGQYDEADKSTAYYKKIFKEANPFIPTPFLTITEETKKKGNLVTAGTYHTAELGIRITPDQLQNSKEHFIISGDSNVFGIGVEDNETLPYFLSRKSQKYFVINFGLAGAGPSNALYFLKNLSLSSIVKGRSKGIFLYEFQPYLIERVIGSKNFVRSNLDSPRFEIADGKLTYTGDFHSSWTALFYNFLNRLPYNEILFPNLPRINHEHIELTAKVLAEIKKEYLKQTLATNRFVVSLNPTFKMPYRKELNYLIECLKKENIEMFTFEDVPKFHLPRFKDEGHYTKVAHKVYADVLWKKLESGK